MKAWELIILLVCTYIQKLSLKMSVIKKEAQKEQAKKIEYMINNHIKNTMSYKTVTVHKCDI